MNKKGTKERILDAAERLFAREGYHRTPLRALTEKAGANLAAVNYHFGSKEALLRAVIERRIVPLNKERISRLKAVRKKSREEKRLPDSREVLIAFIEPTFAFKESGKGAREFFMLVGRSFSEPDKTVRNIFMELVGPLFKLLAEVLAESLPDLPRNIFRWRLQFFIGAMAHTLMMTGDVHITHGDAIEMVDTDDLVDMFVNFVSSGLKAPIK